jgi:hypothetical protein
MGKLNNWNFGDKEFNSGLQLINRQKSALNLELKSLDKEARKAIFTDFSETSLEQCTCDDFNFVGGYARKKFQPCMHIYRLAIELGLMEIEHIGYNTKMKMMTPEERKEIENVRLRSLDTDSKQWGHWNEKVHKNWQQKERQMRAYEIWKDKNISILNLNSAIIHGYQVSLSDCTCPDFKDRMLPCKHIYCLAALGGIELPEKYCDPRNRLSGGIEISVTDGTPKVKLNE